MRRVREGALRSHRAPGAQLKLKRSLGRLCRTRRRRRRGERGRERNFFFFWNRERWRGGAESLQVPRSSPAHWLFSSFVRDRADWSQMALSKLRWGVPCSAAHDAATPPSHNLFFCALLWRVVDPLAKWEDAELSKKKINFIFFPIYRKISSDCGRDKRKTRAHGRPVTPSVQQVRAVRCGGSFRRRVLDNTSCVVHLFCPGLVAQDVRLGIINKSPALKVAVPRRRSSWEIY